MKILDLGLARILDIAKHEMAESDMTVGTPNFMSPEAATGEVEPDARSDIYSMGAMLYQMTTGTLPFYGLDAQSALEGQVNSYIDDPAKLVPALSDSLPWLIEKMMVKKPAGRQQSWDEVIGDIGAVLEGSMIDTPAAVDGASTVLRSSARKQPRRKRRVVVSKQSLRRGGDPAPLLPGRYQVTNDTSRSLLLCLGLGALAGLLYLITYISY